MFKKYTSPNFNDRIGYDVPILIVLHYTGMKTGKDALEHLCKPQSEVSAHYVIEEKGKTHHLVPDEKRAWHAGVSYWGGETDINSASIGIELVNPGHEFGYEVFSKKQIKALVKLCQGLISEYGIKPNCILGHSDVAIGRKVDPGHLFPWEELARHGIGVWPTPQEMDYQAAEDILLNPDGLHELICAYGYDPTLSFEDVIVEFHRHYYPEKFESWSDRPEEPDVATCARLLSLLRQMHEL